MNRTAATKSLRLDYTSDHDGVGMALKRHWWAPRIQHPGEEVPAVPLRVILLASKDLRIDWSLRLTHAPI